MKETKILWVDDEIDFLKVHILFLEEKGHQIITANNGYDAVEIVKDENFDIIFLDENMPGMNGLEVLSKIKEIDPNVPVVMITKNEEEDIMDEAIGSKIADYLIKPVNPNQILLSLKKNIDTKRLVTQKTTSEYQTEFTKLGQKIHTINSFEEWVYLYKKLVFWELELEQSYDNAMDEILQYQKNEANEAFTKFVEKNYTNWFCDHEDERPLMQHQLFKEKVFPLLDDGEQVFLIVIDNLRYDQWRTIMPKLIDYLRVDNEELLCSILPTATQFARNAMFSGLMPAKIEEMFPQYWRNDTDEGGKNEFEAELLETLFERYRKDVKFKYHKVMQKKAGKRLADNFNQLLDYQLNVIVYNFVDMLSHARTEMKMIRELANNEAAYRSLTLTWFEHSALLDIIKKLSEKQIKVLITTDHGTIRVNNPIKVIGDKETTTNLRYKQGKNLNYKSKEVFDLKHPKDCYLPTSNISSSYIFARNKDFFAYPNNYNHYVRYYKDTFQHGGISLEEMLIPFISLSSKNKHSEKNSIN